LRLISDGQVRMENFGTGAWRTVIEGNAISPVVVGRVVSKRWAEWPKGPVGEQICEITASGRIALEEAQSPIQGEIFDQRRT
jgi:hypothetical protein